MPGYAYPECRERNQSPINIVDHNAKASMEYQELTLEGFDAESSNKTSMKNTGKTAPTDDSAGTCPQPRGPPGNPLHEPSPHPLLCPVSTDSG
ncbi:hypothetical protein CRUP_011698 [Coryphaenoides rupestris]|nr:hypothetical protein CRUP_011698 [Coryphaenoides rupestris]